MALQGDSTFVQLDSNSSGGAGNYANAIPLVQDYGILGGVLEFFG